MANLFRTSRLFSLPPPLPSPLSADARFGTNHSETATLPYPTHAAIETSQSSLSRGDWGLKRSLPSRKTSKASSTPLIRIGDVDSRDHITIFESAGDHAITLRKWQEMNLPILTPTQELSSATGRGGSLYLTHNDSVFESQSDNTVKGQQVRGNGRWKFDGPWLAGKTEGEFQNYIKAIRKQKLPLEFWEFVRKQLQQDKRGEQKREAINQGEDYKDPPIEISEEDVDTHVRQLRKDRKLLHQMIERFLDLPSFTEISGEVAVDSESSTRITEARFKAEGPPKTHPSAGLSYLRTSSHIHNHPILGPQAYQPPVCGRVVACQTRLGSKKRPRARIGIAGVVADDNRNTNYKGSQPPGLATFEPDIPGGTKCWYHPQHASIDSQGRIQLKIKHAFEDTLAIYEGILPPEEDFDPSIVEGGDRTFPSTSSPTSTSGVQGQGQRYGLEGTEKTGNGGRAEPFNVHPDLNVYDMLGLSGSKR